MKTPIVMCWSGGKDSALALGRLLASNEWQVVELLTTVTEGYDRISMHGVRKELLEMQAKSIDLPLKTVLIPPECVNKTYQNRMEIACNAYKARGINHMAFGDLFLEDIRNYRNEQLAKVDMHAIYPLWGQNTAQLARDFITQGYEATLCCTDPNQIPETFCGQSFTETLLQTLPKTCDPCGENGEFHTFVHNAPYFRTPIPCHIGEKVLRDNFWFCDITSTKKKAA
ncbi:MAG: hypothetical protein K2Q01_00360, partial [Rickettsiales bacterium]|nr:hypothetical protein [Rickettsiales bacterium]